METAKTTQRIKDAAELRTERVERFRAMLNNNRALIAATIFIGASAAAIAGGYYVYQKNKKGELYGNYLYDARGSTTAATTENK